ncbi:lipopolysaccharide transport periplasmic protein LptA [Roseateles violae]|uniref:Lipopolysaccharide export system protein LptA n=1 Tax=Roseateles violae TaxID=3058042 RepID=A0ABT8DKD7_9BURK|nr:lipopolysaccharide transport periplasmic protein LptA [Pelomonas sp. PFR6]MDN3918875.1 lipopolysaccharide transport periplasmic protein LptA [Pelomonas sp. PFR6]
MPPSFHIPAPTTIALSLLLAATALVPARAEKADRLKPLNIVAERQGSIDLVNQRTEFIGDVTLTKGTMLLRADKVDVRETSEGYFQAYANSLTGRQVSFRQASDAPGETIEGAADQLEYDTRADTVRFIGNAVVRHLRGSLVANEVNGAVIIYDNRTEVFTVEGGPASPNPSGKVRVVMMPRNVGAPAASAPASAASAVGLQPSPTLQPRKAP